MARSVDETARVLSAVIELGVDPLTEGQRFTAVLADLGTAFSRAERQALLDATRAPGFERIWVKRDAEAARGLAGLERWLSDECGYRDDLGAHVGAAWAKALGLPQASTRSPAAPRSSAIPDPVPWKNAALTALFCNNDTPYEGLAALEPPEWDLSSLYPEPAAPIVTQEFEALEIQCKNFGKKYKGRLAGLDSDSLVVAIHAYEQIDDAAGKIMSFVGLRYYMDTSNQGYAAAMTEAQARMTEITAPLVFFALEMNTLSESALDIMCAENPKLARYRPVLDRMRAMRDYQLSELEESQLHAADLDWRQATDRFDKVIASLVVDITYGSETQSFGLEAALGAGCDSNREFRKAASIALGRALGKRSSELTRIYTSLLARKAEEDRRRGLPNPTSTRHLSECIDPKIVYTMENAVMRWLPRISHRYYKLKAGWLGLDRIGLWDTHAPLPFGREEPIQWPSAYRIVRATIEDFSPEFGEIVSEFFARGWVDAKPRPGKASGAFCHPTVPSANPFVSVNFYQGERDLLTLAGMLGHGIHQYLAASQGSLLSATPLTLSSTASQFFETLVSTRLLEDATSDQMRKRILAGFVEDRLNSIARQILLYRFETWAHRNAREGRTLTSEDFGQNWISLQKENYGLEIDLFEGAEHYWSYIPHFYHSPFCTYTYSFGGLVAMALFSEFLKDVSIGRLSFPEKLRALFAAGGSKPNAEILEPFGLDITQPDFWDGGLVMLSKMVDELDAL